jgi:hypothetical protein
LTNTIVLSQRKPIKLTKPTINKQEKRNDKIGIPTSSNCSQSTTAVE